VPLYVRGFRAAYKPCCVAKQINQKAHPACRRRGGLGAVVNPQFTACRQFASARSPYSNLFPLDPAQVLGAECGWARLWETKMAMQNMNTWIGIAAVTLLLAACGSNDAEVQAMAEQMKMNKQQVAAFKLCAKHLRRTQPIFITGDKAVQMTQVPLEVCACHSQTMVKLLKDDKLESHSRFAEYIGKAKRKAKFKVGRQDMKLKITREAGGVQLIDSLKNCANTYVSKNAELSKGLIIPFELPKKKVKKPADGKAAPATGEQQASKS
jgi:hypothetical protein